MYDEDDPRIVGGDTTLGSEEGGRTAIENLMQKDPGINVIHTINEPAAAGAYEGLKSFGMADKVLIVSVDGGCPGVQNVKEDIIGATSMQFPLRMASLGVEAVAEFAKSGKVPENTEGLGFFRHRRRAGDGRADRGHSIDLLGRSADQVLGLKRPS